MTEVIAKEIIKRVKCKECQRFKERICLWFERKRSTGKKRICNYFSKKFIVKRNIPSAPKPLSKEESRKQRQRDIENLAMLNDVKRNYEQKKLLDVALRQQEHKTEFIKLKKPNIFKRIFRKIWH